jgi:hypothetical protein
MVALYYLVIKMSDYIIWLWEKDDDLIDGEARRRIGISDRPLPRNGDLIVDDHGQFYKVFRILFFTEDIQKITYKHLGGGFLPTHKTNIHEVCVDAVRVDDWNTEPFSDV